MKEFGYQSCDADPNLWMNAQYGPEAKSQYYSYNLCYVDDILCIHHDPDNVLNKLNRYEPLKSVLIGSPNLYLGTKLKHIKLHNDISLVHDSI